MKGILFFMLLTPFIAMANAATEEVERKAQGFGASYEEALTSALIEAVRQVRGLEAGSEPLLHTQMTQIISSFGIVTRTEQHVEQNIYTQSQGWIKSYSVKEVVKPQNKEDNWMVSVLAIIPVYEEMISEDKRKTIAVMPFAIAYRDVMTGGLELVIDNIAERISEAMLSEISRSKKLAVVNRAYDREFFRESGLLASNQVSPTEASRLGQKLGADLMIVGKIHQLSFEKKPAFYGMNNPGYDADVSLFYSVVETATEKILWANTLDYTYSGRDDKNLLSGFITDLSSSLTAQMMDTLYPIKVIELRSPEQIILDQGDKRLQPGQLLDVFSASREAADPDTGMPIKLDGIKVAQIEVVEVLPGYTIAKWVSGDYQLIKLHASTRQSNITEQVTKDSTRPLTPGSSDKPFQW